jgi:pyrimidine-nucleoside phosphorylase
MTIIELIERKRDGGELSELDIAWLIGSFSRDEVPDYQMAALLMAVFLNGLNAAELAAWTEAMLHSGEVMDLSGIAGPKVDKHSTGGVGDKVSIPLAPMVAECGVVVPMISGRGLGHTGGTLDKMESIPGLSTALDPAEFHAIVSTHGMVMAGQSETLAPADRRIYALRDATATVPSIPLISSSIMSKKLAEGIDGLVLDVKVGVGAFMRDVASARRLAETMVGIGKSHGTAVVALLTAMDEPLGDHVGNASEVAESIAVLRGEGPPDLTELVHRLGAEMLVLGGVAPSHPVAAESLQAAVDSGAALAKFRDVVGAQGGDPSAIDDPTRLPQAANVAEVSAPASGYVVSCNALAVGRAAVRLGAGRARKEDGVDPGVGIQLLAKQGAKVAAGEPLAAVRWADQGRLAAAMEVLRDAWLIGDEAPQPQPLILEEVR